MHQNFDSVEPIEPNEHFIMQHEFNPLYEAESVQVLDVHGQTYSTAVGYFKEPKELKDYYSISLRKYPDQRALVRVTIAGKDLAFSAAMCIAFIGGYHDEL